MKHECPHIQELMQRTLDGDLAEGCAEVVRLHAHLAVCPDCREAFTTLERTQAALRCWEAPTVDPQVSVAFTTRLAERAAPRISGARLVRFRRALAWGAAVLLVGVSVWLLPTEKPDPATPRPPAQVSTRAPESPVAACETTMPVASPSPAPASPPRMARERRAPAGAERPAATAGRPGRQPQREAPASSLPDATLAAVALLAEAMPDATALEAPPVMVADAAEELAVASSPELAVLAAWAEVE